MSQESEDEDAYCFLDVELEALHSIYINELEVSHNEGKSTTVTIHLHPSTADNVEEQYVCLSLIFDIPIEYPDKVPEILIRNPRGLSDEKLDRIAEDLITIAEERKGGTMLFELIECAKDHLTSGNRPSCQCAICLHGFTDEDMFTKTKCYHYFHSHCLSRYVRHQFETVEKEEFQSKSDSQVQEVLCPVCRVPIEFDIMDEDFPPPCSAKEDSFIISDELLVLQEQMKNLFEKQKAQGGIIDIEAEKNKFLLEISTIPSVAGVQDLESEEKVSLSTGDGNENPVSAEKLRDSILTIRGSKSENLSQNDFTEKSTNCLHGKVPIKEGEGKSKRQYDYKNKTASNEKSYNESTAFRHTGTSAGSKRISPAFRNSRNVPKREETVQSSTNGSNPNGIQEKKYSSADEFQIDREYGKSALLQNDLSVNVDKKKQQKKYTNSYNVQNQFHQNRNVKHNYIQHRDYHRQRNNNNQRPHFGNRDVLKSSYQDSNFQNAIPVVESERQNSKQIFRGKSSHQPRNKNFGGNSDNGYNHRDRTSKGSYYPKKDLTVEKTEGLSNIPHVNSKDIPFFNNLRTESKASDKNTIPEESQSFFSITDDEQDWKALETHNKQQYRQKFQCNNPNRFPVREQKTFASKIEPNAQNETQDRPQRYEVRKKPFNRRPYNQSSRNSYGNKKNYHNVSKRSDIMDLSENCVASIHQQEDPRKSSFSKDKNSHNSNFQSVTKGCEISEEKNCIVPNRTNSCCSVAPPLPPPGFAKKVVYGLPSVKPPPGFDRS